MHKNNEQKMLTQQPHNEQLNNVDVQKVLEELDSASNNRKNVPFYWKWFVSAVCIFLSSFHIYTAVFGTLPSNQQRGLHLALGLCLIFLLYPGGKQYDKRKWVGTVCTVLMISLTAWAYWVGKITFFIALSAGIIILLIHWSKQYNRSYKGIPICDIILAVLGLSAGLYQFFFFEEIISRVGMYSNIDYIIAVIGVLLVLEAARRIVGLPIALFGAIMLVYAHFGSYMPDLISHRGFSIERIISHQFLSTEAIFGIPIAISSTFIYLYLLFGVILRRTGLEKFFTDISLALVGRMTGGPAKIGVLTSAFSGTITGSSVANTVGNGAFTIPMMKRAGYKPEYAAAVEAASSTGGQILPPIMGSAAFLMIEFTGMPYQQIVQAAILPAILWFTAQFFAVHYESKKSGIMGLPKEQLPNFWHLLITRGYMLLPIIAILAILMMGMSVMKAAMYGIYTALAMNIFAMIIAKMLGRQDMIEDKLTPKIFLEILVEAAKTALPVIAACAAAGVIGGVITLTGLGLKLTGAILELANNQLMLTMVFTMIASIVLGMGLPTTANYVITATVAAPALLAFDNVPILAAHMFVFYFGIIADITPPVALASYAGAGLARANPFITSLNSVKIAIGGFIIPYIMVLSPVLVLENFSFISLAIVLTTAVLGMYCISTALAGFINRLLMLWEQVALVIAGILFIHPDTIASLIGILLFTIVMINQKLINKGKA